jgi:hypothetical protein
MTIFEQLNELDDLEKEKDFTKSSKHIIHQIFEIYQFYYCIFKMSTDDVDYFKKDLEIFSYVKPIKSCFTKIKEML